MNINRFKECCAAFGAQRRRWPESEQALYDHFVGSLEGAAILAEAERTDRWLDRYETAPPDPRLMRHIAGLSRPAWQRFGAPAAVFAACGLLGFVLGFVQVQRAAETSAMADLLLGPQNLQELAL